MPPIAIPLWTCRMRGIFIEVGCPDEYKATRGDDRSAVVFCARLVLPLCGEIGVLAKWNLPGIVTSIEIDRVQSTPRRQDGWISFGIQKLVISGEAILHGAGSWIPTVSSLLFRS